jgi:hypothetical protein
MKVKSWKFACLIGLTGLICSMICVSAAATVSASTQTTKTPTWTTKTTTCSGTAKAPGVLKGRYKGNVAVSGVCVVNAGRVVVADNLTVSAGSVLNATFGLDRGKKGTYSNLTVDGNLNVKAGAVLVMGCNPTNFPCMDDPNSKKPTISSWDWVRGSLISTDPLGVIVHSSFIGRNLTEKGGGGGVTCTPQGIFKALNSPVFSDYENVIVGGNMNISDIRTCWFGSVRDDIHGNFSNTDNKMADPDADEVIGNYVNGSLTCSKNSPAVQFGDSSTAFPIGPNVVNGAAKGECSFTTLKPNPSIPKVIVGTLQHISVPATA